MSQAPWRAVLFDLDGTLADTVDLILRSYRHTMKTHLGKAPPDERWLSTIGRPLRDSLAEFASGPEESAAMRETYVAFQRSIHDELVAPYSGVPEAVARLAEVGIPLAVVTSKGREIAGRTLRTCGLEDRFPVLISADDVERGKPDPEPVHLALDRLGLAGLDTAGRREVLFVGDSPFDMRAGRQAGVSTAAALWGPFARGSLEPEEPDHWLERVDQILGVRPGG